MGVPKRRSSKLRVARRRAQNMKIKVPQLVRDASGQLIKPHYKKGNK